MTLKKYEFSENTYTLVVFKPNHENASGKWLEVEKLPPPGPERGVVHMGSA